LLQQATLVGAKLCLTQLYSAKCLKKQRNFAHKAARPSSLKPLRAMQCSNPRCHLQTDKKATPTNSKLNYFVFG